MISFIVTDPNRFFRLQCFKFAFGTLKVMLLMRNAWFAFNFFPLQSHCCCSSLANKEKIKLILVILVQFKREKNPFWTVILVNCAVNHYSQNQEITQFLLNFNCPIFFSLLTSVHFMKWQKQKHRVSCIVPPKSNYITIKEPTNERKNPSLIAGKQAKLKTRTQKMYLVFFVTSGMMNMLDHYMFVASLIAFFFWVEIFFFWIWLWFIRIRIQIM